MSSSRTLGAIAFVFTACADHGTCGAEPARANGGASIVQRTLTVDEVERRLLRPGARFEPTTVAERDVLVTLVPAMARAAAGAPPELARWDARAREVGLGVEEWHVTGERYWALVEQPERRRGAGAYVFRVAPTSPHPILLEAPHVFHDVGTGQLAAAMFFAPPPGPRPAALFTNTVHRYQAADGSRVKRPDSPADVCHNPDHGYTTATVAFADAVGGAVVIQLHGFGRNESGPLAGASIVVSAGDAARSSPRSAAVAAALAGVVTGVRRFPEETQQLGATTNVQGRALRRVAGAEFVHVETDLDLRTALRADAARRDAFAQALFGAAEAR